MILYLLPHGIGVSDGVAVKNTGTLTLELSGETVDGITVGGRHHAVVGGKVTIQTAGLKGVVNITAHNRPLRRAWHCEDLFFEDDLVIPIARLTPAEYIAMAAAAEKAAAELNERVKKLEAAVYGVPLFGKEDKI